MALGTPFYHGIIRKTIVAFGELFSDTNIERIGSNGTTTQVIPIPISYGPKEKWLRRLQENPDLQKTERITVPRMAFEIVGYSYDASRRMPHNYLSSVERLKLFTPVPYNLDINLHILTRTQEDMLNITEQILPYFAPTMEVTINILDAPATTTTFPIALTSIDMVDNYDVDFDDQRIITNTLSFTVKVNLFGPINSNTGGVIKKVIAGVGADPTYVSGQEFTSTVDPFTADANDEYTTIDEWTTK